ncbi:HEPN/Toprim-associated domain-containing protein [Xanthomonas campestris]|uniref:HEPN/Toprim-associated domain-containing protein n=1 Tax=Xanthomonas campestris TaxID=339 RepID=UPI003890BCAD
MAGLDETYIEYEIENRDALSKGRFAADQKDVARIPVIESSGMYWSERSYFGAVVCILSPYSMLQIFGRSPSNADAEVMWQYGPIVDAGWVDIEDFKTSARRSQTILVATEGTTDARILRHAIDLLCPEVADFFRFIDVDERHPFWGTGNLVKFAEGLVRIDVQNQVVFLLDNDAEGRDAYRRLQAISRVGRESLRAGPNLL